MVSNSMHYQLKEFKLNFFLFQLNYMHCNQQNMTKKKINFRILITSIINMYIYIQNNKFTCTWISSIKLVQRNSHFNHSAHTLAHCHQ